MYTIISLELSQLHRLSIGVPLSLNLVNGRSFIFNWCRSPVSVNMQILSVFITGMTYLFSLNTASLFLSNAAISMVLAYPNLSIINITSISGIFFSSNTAASPSSITVLLATPYSFLILRRSDLITLAISFLLPSIFSYFSIFLTHSSYSF